MELPTKGKDLGLYEAASVIFPVLLSYLGVWNYPQRARILDCMKQPQCNFLQILLNVVNQQQHTFKPVGKGIRRALLLHCKNAEQGDSLEGQRRERDLGKCQK